MGELDDYMWRIDKGAALKEWWRPLEQGQASVWPFVLEAA